MAKKFRKNPNVHVVTLPGVGRVTADMVLEGDQFEKFTLPMFGASLVSFEDEVVAAADPVPASVVVQPPAGAVTAPVPEHVVGSDEVTPVVVDISNVPPGSPVAPVLDTAAVVDVSDMTPTEAQAAVASANEEAPTSEEASVEAPTSAMLDTMSQRRLRKLAAAHDISIPKTVKTVDQLREHLRGILFPNE